MGEEDDRLRKALAKLERHSTFSGGQRLILALTAVAILLFGIAERYAVRGDLADLSVQIRLPSAVLETLQLNFETGLFAIFLIFMAVATLARVLFEQMQADTIRALRRRLAVLDQASGQVREAADEPKGARSNPPGSDNPPN